MILQADCRYLPLKDKSVGGIITSPPYNVKKNYPNNTDALSHSEYVAFLKACYAECRRVTTGPVVWVLPLWANKIAAWDHLRDNGGPSPWLGFRVIHGHAASAQSGNAEAMPQPRVELAVYDVQPEERGRELTWYIPSPIFGGLSRRRPNHPAPFPKEIPQRLMTMWPSVQSWLDPFGGTGTTMLCARLRGLKWMSMDLAWEYCLIQRSELAQGVLLTAK